MAEATGGLPWATFDEEGWLASTAEGVMVLDARRPALRRLDLPHDGWVLFHGVVQIGPRLWRVEWEPDAASATLRAAAGGRRTTEVGL